MDCTIPEDRNCASITIEASTVAKFQSREEILIRADIDSVSTVNDCTKPQALRRVAVVAVVGRMGLENVRVR